MIFLSRPWTPCRPEGTGTPLNYTSVLNIAFLVLAAVLVFRFVRTGGVPMLRTMGGGPAHDAPTASSSPRDHLSSGL
jgi:hypothetical protein